MPICPNSKDTAQFCRMTSNSILRSSEWLTHQHRDTLSSIVGHPTLTSYLAIADGESIGRVKFEMTEVTLAFGLFHSLDLTLPFKADVAAVWAAAEKGGGL